MINVVHGRGQALKKIFICRIMGNLGFRYSAVKHNFKKPLAYSKPVVNGLEMTRFSYKEVYFNIISFIFCPVLSCRCQDGVL